MKKEFLHVILVPLCILIITSCNSPKKDQVATPSADTIVQSATIKESSFGSLPDGTALSLFHLKNINGVEVDITNYGGIITSIRTPDKSGKVEDIVLGYDSLAGYLKAPSFFGALVGRYGNRIAKGKFKLDGKNYTLVTNNGANHLHGGTKGFDKVVWKATPSSSSDSVALKLEYLSKDMEEGYPGNLQVQVTYVLNNNNELKIQYHATTDKRTVLNLTNHSYFNLSGNTKTDILGQKIQIEATHFIPVDKGLIPFGEIRPVKGTPFDFTKATVIGSRINDSYEQIKTGIGYDHCFVFDKPAGSMGKVVTASDSVSGRVMEVSTTEPGTQFYTGNFLDGSITGKYGTVYKQRYAFCIETQHFPDSPNQPKFPSVVLSPGEQYNTQTIFKFSW